jgi:anti-sigma factor ChrR (cupin superfamily)
MQSAEAQKPRRSSEPRSRFGVEAKGCAKALLEGGLDKLRVVVAGAQPKFATTVNVLAECTTKDFVLVEHVDGRWRWQAFGGTIEQIASNDDARVAIRIEQPCEIA